MVRANRYLPYIPDYKNHQIIRTTGLIWQTLVFFTYITHPDVSKPCTVRFPLSTVRHTCVLLPVILDECGESCNAIISHHTSWSHCGGLDDMDERGWKGHHRGHLKVNRVKLKTLIFLLCYQDWPGSHYKDHQNQRDLLKTSGSYNSNVCYYHDL